MLSLQRDVEDLLEEFSMPRSMHREIERIFDESASPRAIFRDMDRLMDEFETPRALSQRLERLFEGFAGGGRRREGREGREGFVPTVDVADRENEYVIKADLPGLREKDIELHVDEDNTLTVSGERREEESRTTRGYHHRERSYGAFARTLSLPPGVDRSKIQADFRNGVLEIHVPKTEAGRTRRIPVSPSSRDRDERTIPVGGNGQHAINNQVSTS